MTRVEAIKFGTAWLGIQEKLEGCEMYEFFKMSVKALQEEPCEAGWIPVTERLPEKDGRYLAYIIDKNDVRSPYIMTCEYLRYNSWWPDDECSSDNVIAWMPLPEEYKEPKMGQWVLLDECANSGYYCSECHKKIVKEGWSDTVKKIKYCPNCGAKMEGLGA